MEESKPNYRVERVVIGGHEMFRDPFSGNLAYKTKEMIIYFSPQGKIIETKRNYLARYPQLKPQILFGFKPKQVLCELFAYERWGRPPERKLECSNLRSYGLAITNFIVEHFSPNKKFAYDIQKGIWGETITQAILESFEDFRNDRFTEVNPSSDFWTRIDQSTLADLLDKNIKAIFLHYDRVDLTDPVYFFRHLTHRIEESDDKIWPKPASPPIKSDILYLPPDFK